MLAAELGDLIPFFIFVDSAPCSGAPAPLAGFGGFATLLLPTFACSLLHRVGSLPALLLLAAACLYDIVLFVILGIFGGCSQS